MYSAPSAQDVYSLDGVYLLSSRRSDIQRISLLRSLKAISTGFYKHVAPTEPDLELSKLRTVFHYLIANAFGGDATPPSLLSGAAVKKNS